MSTTILVPDGPDINIGMYKYSMAAIVFNG
jgi:hypothetical protein